MTPEGRVKAAVKTWLSAEGLIPASQVRKALEEGHPFEGWYFMPVQSRFSIKGIPDFVGIWNSVGWGIETKVEGGTPTDNQRDQLEAIQRAGGISAVVSHVSQLAEFKARMEEAWKNAHLKSLRNSNASNAPTQSGGFRKRHGPSSTPTSMEFIASLVATAYPKGVSAWAESVA